MNLMATAPAAIRVLVYQMEVVWLKPKKIVILIATHSIQTVFVLNALLDIIS
jgi:hypothetical protein